MKKSDLKPMLATLIDAPFNDPDWIFETKWDGFRLIAAVTRDKVLLYSRNGSDVTKRYPMIAAALSKMRGSAVIDGELVALDRRGRSRFQLLQNALRARARLRYCVFDLLFIDGRDLRHMPLLKRKEMLRQIVPKSALIRFSSHIVGAGKKLFGEARQGGEEGIMAKRAASAYHSGARTREWLKIKNGHEQEVVIAGFTAPRRSRQYFGALVLAVYHKGALTYVGHAGTGFTREDLRALYQGFKPLVVKRKPFSGKIPHEPDTTWLKPRLVCEVKFTEWTADGEMRHPVFMGLRDDKRARDVTREHALV